MSDAYLGEIRIFSGNFAPVDWKICDGSLLNVVDFQALYSVIGITYGGNGTTNFALPDLCGRIPVGQGQGTGLSKYTLAAKGGTEAVNLTTTQIPSHTHSWIASAGNGSTNTPSSNVMLATPAGTSNQYTMYRAPGESGLTTTAGPADMISPAGGSQAHANMMPSIALNYIICVKGGYPQSA